MTASSFKIYDSTEIDPEKWDHCIDINDNGLFYARYHYLSYLCTNWSAVIIGNYEAVMPLPWKKKWGIRYYCAIPFCQQLGLIGSIDKNIIPNLIDLVNEFASFGDLFLNFDNHQLAVQVASFAKLNLILNLNQVYPKIEKEYTKDLVQNLEKAKKLNPQYQISTAFKTALRLYQEQYGSRLQQVKSRDFEQFCSLLAREDMTGKYIVREVIDPINNNILSSALLLKDQRRLYLIINVITKKGRTYSANHYLIDQIIQEFSETNLILDFEGSEIPGVREFYENFRPQIQPYYHFHHNRLPWPLNLIKK